MIYNRITALCFLVLITFVGINELKAQSYDLGTTKATITTNYKQFYVIVGDSIKHAQLLNNRDMFEFEAGVKTIWVIPKYSAPYSFNNDFEKDSIYVLDVAFRNTLDQPSQTYNNIRNNLVASPTITTISTNSTMVTSSISKFTKWDYEKHINPIIKNRESYLKIISNVDSIYVNTSLNNSTLKHIASGDSIAVQPGLKSIYVSHPKSVQRLYRKHFIDSTTTTIQHTFNLNPPTATSLTDNIATKPHYNSNLIIVSDHDSKIIVNGLFIGTGAVKLSQETGPVNISIINDYMGEFQIRSQVLNTKNEYAVVEQLYTKPKRSTANFLSLFPGGSQLYKQQKVKGYAISGGFLLSGILSFVSHQNYKSELDEFNALQKKYNLTTNAQLVLEYGDALEKQQKVVADLDNKRIAFFSLTSLIYAYNLYDGLFTSPKSGFRKNTNIDFFLNNEVIDNQNYSTISLRYDF